MVEVSRRREIEDVASELFRENGYAGTSVREIARAMSMQGASLYAHVASKENVLWAIVDRAASRFEAAADAAEVAADREAPGDSEAAVEALVRAHVRVLTDDVEGASVFAHEWRSLGPDHRAAVLARRDAYEARFRRRIQAGIADGVFAMTDPALAATVVLTALNGIAGWYRPEGRLGPDRIADHLAELVLRLLTAAAR